MIKYNTYKELFQNKCKLNIKLKENEITKEEAYSLQEILSIEKELDEIRNQNSDEYWQSLILSFMTEETKKEYKITNSNRQVTAYRDNKEIPVYLKRTLIVPLDYDVNELTTKELLDAGEYAKLYFDKGLVLYFDNNTFIGLPLNLRDKLNEVVYDIYKQNNQKKSR